jgi:HD superfamily phosphohydrolase
MFNRPMQHTRGEESPAVRDALELLASELLPDDYVLRAGSRPKAIHDNVWGTQILMPWEIDVLDTPLLQRLRGIHQTGITYLTYPSTSQTRFEHTLGCVAVATRLLDEIDRKTREAGEAPPSPTDRQEVRLAVLLHDCGHGLFSHATEGLAGEDPGVRALISEERLAGSGPYEAFSHMIVRSNAFARFLERLKDRHPSLAEVDQRRVADMVVGRGTRDRRYLANIVSGPFDADKIDYIARDSRASGIEFTIDLPRLLYGIEVQWIRRAEPRYTVATEADTEAVRALLLRWSAAQVLEQILFAKVQLFLLVYHHGKVRAAEALTRAALRRAWEEGLLQSPVDLLRGSDEACVQGRLPGGRSADEASADIRAALEHLRLRMLPRRAAVLSMATVVESETLAQLVASSEKADLERELAGLIRADASLPGAFDVLVDLPSLPPLTEVARSVVLDQNDVDVISLNDVFSGQDWFTVYTLRKWRGHVFGPFAREKQRAVFEATAKSFDDLGLTLDDLAATLARVPVA